MADGSNFKGKKIYEFNIISEELKQDKYRQN